MNVSIAMTTYNGESYIEEQIRSICDQLDSEDELVISDDGSTDSTLAIIESLKGIYGNIIIIKGPQKGIVANFGNAISACKNEIIFLSDQDDIWMQSKINEIKKAFQDESVKLVLHDGYSLINDECRDNFIRPYKKGLIRNLLFSSYWGCCMAFRKDFIEDYLPFKDDVVAHDQLIGLLSERVNGTFYCDQKLIKHRFHSNNKTVKLPLNRRIIFRYHIMKNYLNAIKRT